MYTLLLFVFIASAAAHKVEWGACPMVDPVENLDMDKFQGRWFVIKKVETKMSCITDYFTRLAEEGSFNYTERQQLFNQIIFNEAEIRLNGKGKMEIDYPFLIPNAVVEVPITDYDNYAVIYKCQSFPAFRRWSASVLSRTPEMDTARANELENEFKDMVKSLRNVKMDFIDWSDCVTDDEAQFTIGIGPELNFRPGGQVVKSMADGFRGLAGDVMSEDIEFF